MTVFVISIDTLRADAVRYAAFRLARQRRQQVLGADQHLVQVLQLLVRQGAFGFAAHDGEVAGGQVAQPCSTAAGHLLPEEVVKGHGDLLRAQVVEAALEGEAAQRGLVRRVGLQQGEFVRAAAECLALIDKGYIEQEPNTAFILDEECSGCKSCVPLCPYTAIAYDEAKEKAFINEALCKGCGTCVAACPSGSISQHLFEDEQIFSEIAGLLASEMAEA